MPWISEHRLGQQRLGSEAGQEELSGNVIHDEGQPTKSSNLKRRPAPPATFRFGYRRQPIDWRVLHGIDIQRMVMCTYDQSPG